MVSCYDIVQLSLIGVLHKGNIQRCTKWYANIVKHYAGKARQKSLATAVTNFSKPETHH